MIIRLHRLLNGGGGDMIESDFIAQKVREAARAAFILDEALRLDIRVGAANDGSELAIVTPRGMPHAVYCTFRDAILEVREAVIDHILVENGVRP